MSQTEPSRTAPEHVPRVLIVYGTTEGQTRDVACKIAELARAGGAEAAFVHSAEAGARLEGSWDGVIVAASVHQGHHQTAVRAFVAANLPRLRGLHSAFVSLSLSAAAPDPARQGEALGYIEAFLAETGWQPDVTLSLGGALRQAEYGPYEQLVLGVLGYQLGGGTVGPHDRDYTDWKLVEAFARRFVAYLKAKSTLTEPPPEEPPPLWW